MSFPRRVDHDVNVTLPGEGRSMMAALQAAASASTHDRRRAEAMGFVFSEPQVFGDYRNLPVIRGSFRCVCGREEHYSFTFTPVELMMLSDATLEHVVDIGRRLREFGSFSRAHLLEDGYPPAVVDDILARGEAFDRGQPAQPVENGFRIDRPARLPMTRFDWWARPEPAAPAREAP